MEKLFYVYILASRINGAIYIGVTSDLIKRVWQHREGVTEGHTKKYNIKMLVYYEIHENAESAILREKRLKKWTRPMKNDLIHRYNPDWEDLYPFIAGWQQSNSVIPAQAGISVSTHSPVAKEIPAFAGMTESE